jgi:hypothetical protein
VIAQSSINAADTGLPLKLEHLILQASPDFPHLIKISLRNLVPFIEQCPNLLRIEVPEDYMDLEGDDLNDIDALTAILTARAAERLKDHSGGPTIGPEEVGIFTTETPANQGVGLKRSLVYPG